MLIFILAMFSVAILLIIIGAIDNSAARARHLHRNHDCSGGFF